MEPSVLIEIFGYFGSALVVLSMLMSSIVKLRVVNTIGSIVSGIYALIVGAFPLVLMNGCLIVINVYNLYKLLKTKQVYDFVETTTEDVLVNYFLNRYYEDIKVYFPAFDLENSKGKLAFIACCEGKPAGALIGELKEGKFNILIDYSTPEYRDCSVGNFFYSQLTSKNIQEIIFSQQLTKVHQDYMDKVGFVKVDNTYIKKIK